MLYIIVYFTKMLERFQLLSEFQDMGIIVITFLTLFQMLPQTLIYSFE